MIQYLIKNLGGKMFVRILAFAAISFTAMTSVEAAQIKLSCKANTATIDDSKLFRLGGESLGFQMPLELSGSEYFGAFTVEFKESPYQLKIIVTLPSSDFDPDKLFGSAVIHLISCTTNSAFGSALISDVDIVSVSMGIVSSEATTKIMAEGCDLNDREAFGSCIDSDKFKHGDLLSIEVENCRLFDR